MLATLRQTHAFKPLIHAIDIAKDHLPAVNQLATLAFGENGYDLIETRDVATAFREARGERRILLLGSPNAAQLQEAQGMTDAENLPAWVVVAYGATPATRDAISISETETVSDSVATILRLALEAHTLRRSHERAKGDLLTLSSRVCHDLRSPFNTLQTAIHLLVSPDLSPDYPRQEISEPALNSLALQNKLISRISLLTEASGKDTATESVAMEQAFSVAMDKSRRLLDEVGGAVQPPDSWPSGTLGVQTWAEAMWEAMIATLLKHKHTEKQLSIDSSESEEGIVTFWIRAKFTGDDEKEQGIHAIPFNLLHMYRDSRDLGPPLVHRLAQLQGGTSAVEVDEEGYLRFVITLPRAR